MKHSLLTTTLRSLTAVAMALSAALACADEDLNSTQAVDEAKPAAAAQNQPAITVPAVPKVPTITPRLKKRTSVLTLSGRGSSPIIVRDAKGNVVEIIDQRTLRPLNRVKQGVIERAVDRRKIVLEEFAKTEELRVKTLVEAQETMKLKAVEMEKTQAQALRERELQDETRAKMLADLTPGLSAAAKARMERGAKYTVKRRDKSLSRSSIRQPRRTFRRTFR